MRLLILLVATMRAVWAALVATDADPVPGARRSIRSTNAADRRRTDSCSGPPTLDELGALAHLIKIYGSKGVLPAAKANSSTPEPPADPITSRCPRCRRLNSRLSCPRSSLFAEESGPATVLIADGENPVKSCGGNLESERQVDCYLRSVGAKASSTTTANLMTCLNTCLTGVLTRGVHRESR